MEAADEGKHRYRYSYMDDPLRKFMYHMQVHSMNLYSGSRGHWSWYSRWWPQLA
jgi:hypothetical protein